MVSLSYRFKGTANSSTESYQYLEMTVHGMHRFITRHPDEMTIIDNHLHVIRTFQDLLFPIYHFILQVPKDSPPVQLKVTKTLR